jgi:hypothetical protein
MSAAAAAARAVAARALGTGRQLSPSGVLAAAKDRAAAAGTDLAADAALRSAGLSATDAAFIKTSAGGTSGITSAASSVQGFFSVTIPSIGRGFINGLTFSPLASTGQKALSWFIVLVLIAAITISILQSRGYFTSKPNPPADAESTAGILAVKAATAARAIAPTKAPTRAPTKEGFEDMEVIKPEPTTADTTLLSSQPMTIKHAALLNPTMDGTLATMNALKSGFRAFTLQIDYLESDKAGFPPAGTPTLLYRDATGTLISENAGSIEDVAKAIATYAFTPESPNSSQPVLLYLHIVRAPSQIQSPEKYASFLGSIAESLNPIAPVHLGMTAMGDFHRQKQEGALLTTPLSSLAGHVIILCNADTSVAADPSKPANDLDYWVNMRVYSDGTTDPKIIGVAQPFAATTGVAAAVVTSLPILTAMNQSQTDSIAIEGKSRFIIAMPHVISNPSPTVLNHALNACGVNIVPIDIFTVETEEAVNLTAEYGNVSWPQKSDALL